MEKDREERRGEKEGKKGGKGEGRGGRGGKKEERKTSIECEAAFCMLWESALENVRRCSRERCSGGEGEEEEEEIELFSPSLNFS